MANDQVSGSRWLEPFAFFDPESSSWRTCQGSLLEDSGEFCTTWPREGTWDRGFAYVLPTSEPLTSGSDSSSLLPTPSAYESTPTEEFTEEVREHLGDPHTRLYLPGRKWHAQRTLSRIVPALLPTPMSSDGEKGSRGQRFGTGSPTLSSAVNEETRLLPTPIAGDGHRGADFAREGRRGDIKGTGDDLTTTIAKMLPTPMASDSEASGSQPDSRARLKRGPSLTDAILRDGEVDLLPTPQARDYKGRNQRDDETCLPGAVSRLLPTPVANPDNPGAGGELRAALTHGEGRRNETGTDTMGRPNRGRPSSGAPTDPPSVDGKTSSDDRHPDQLTIGDD